MATSIQNMSDAEFHGWLNAYVATLSANLADYPGLAAGDLTSMGAFRDTYADDLLVHDQTEEARNAATITKNGSREAAEDEAIRLKNLTKANGVSDAAYAALGFPSGPTGEAATPNATVPVAMVDTSERLRHTIHFSDASNPSIKRRPRGVVGVEIWKKVDGPPPGSEKDCTFVALDTSTPYVAEYDQEDAGKMVHYMLRWQLKDGTMSSWGETVSATITG